MKFRRIKILAILFLIASCSFAQEDDEVEIDKSTPDFLLEQDTIFVQKKKKKKRKKKTFNKLKTRRGYTTRGAGRGRTDELFFYLKKYREPSKYVSPIFIYDRKELRLLKLKKGYSAEKYPPKRYRIPHGPYVKKRGDVVLEEGYFWIGSLHDNWFNYTKGEEMIVEERREYHKGFPENYKISYYDPAQQTIVKEIQPYDHYGRNTGVYKYYYENGHIKEAGRIVNGRKTGEWKEFYENGIRKREVEYTWNEEEQKLESKVTKEWRKNGKLTDEFEKKLQEKKKEKYAPMKF